MKKNVMGVLSVIILALIISCGDDDPGGNTESFGRVYLYATYEGDLYEADAAIWTDVTADDGLCDGTLTFVDDDVPITITSTENQSLSDNTTASPVKIMSYTVEFFPYEDSPAVPPKQIYHEWVIEPGETTEIFVRVIDQEDKATNSSHPLNYTSYQNFVSAGGTSYEYTVRVSLKAEEVLTGVKKTLKVQFPLHYLDLDDGCT